MKKIIGAALLGTMAAGIFAADAKIALNFRGRLDAFSQVMQDTGADKDAKSTSRNWLFQNGYSGASSDNFDFQLNGENAGVRVTWALKNEDWSTDWNAKQYSGYMKFNAGPGVLTLEAGRWGDGYADGNYRVKKDVDAMNAEGLDFERFKLGAIFSGSNGLAFVDDLGFSGKVSGFANYKFNVNDDISLNFTVGGVKNDSFDEVEDGDTTTKWKSALASRVQFGMKNLLNAEFIYKKGVPRYNTFALYIMPQIMKELTLNVGGAMELYTGDADYMDWAVDLRLRYQVMNPLSITLFTNISGTDLDAGRKISAGIVAFDGSQGNYGKGNAVNYGTNKQFKTAMWNQLGARYVVNDLLTATLNVGLITPLEKAKDDKDTYNPEWRVVPGVQIYAEKNASIWAAVALSGASAKISDKEQSVFAVNIPVIFRVKM